MPTITLNDIPFSFLREHSYILYVYGRNDDRVNYGRKPLPNDFEGSIGEFIDKINDDKEFQKRYPKFLGQITRDIDDHGRRLCMKHFIIDLYEAVNSDIPFKLFRIHSDFKKKKRPAIYERDDMDNMSLKDIFKHCDDETKGKIGISLVPCDQYSECIKLLVFQKISDTDNFTAQLRAFIRCFIEYKSSLSEDGVKHSEKFARRYKYVSYDTALAKLGDLAKEFNVSPESIRLSLMGSLKHCRELLYEGAVECYFAPTFIDRLAKLKEYIDGKLPAIKKEELCDLIGADIDEMTFSFICDLFDIKLYQYENYDSIYINSKIQTKQLNHLFVAVCEYFSEFPNGVTAAQVNARLKDFDDEYRKIVLRFIDDSYCFKREQVDDETLYFIKWQYLKTKGDRIARIIYENNGSMELKNIVADYNSRCVRVQGIKTITPAITNDREDLIETVGRTGVWRLRTKTMLGRDNIKSVEDLIKEFLRTLPSDTEFAYGDLKAYMSRRGGDVYPDASIKTTINRLGYVVKIKGEDIYVLNDDTRWSIDELIKAIADTLAAADERKMRKMDLLNAVMKNTGRQINTQTFSKAIETASDIFVIEEVNRKTKYVKLRPVNLDDVDFSVYCVERSSPEYYKAIKQTAIDELLRNPNHTMLLSELKSMVEKYVPGDRDNSVVYRIFEREDIFIKTKEAPKKISLNLKLYKELYSNGLSMYASGGCDKVVSSRGMDIEFGFNWDELKQMIISNVNIAFRGVSREKSGVVLDRMYDIMRGSFHALSSDNQFWKTLDLWNRFYKYPTSCYERELLSTKLILGVENYLENLLCMHNVVCKTDGLSAKITEAQKSGVLPVRDKDHKINKLIGLIIKTRNRYSHINNENHHDVPEIFYTIDKCMQFYIYVAEYEMENNAG